ncbi:hypothetical protein IKQ19_19535 [Candidatus Saccharibacteria bacterium]|nr:hypothetical protein [Candidatus Saccharibacteria bacterium]
MVNAVFLVFLLFFSSCTSSQLRATDHFLGGFKVTKSFPIDLNSREKHVYAVHSIEKPSIWGQGREGGTAFTIALCVDRKDENHWPASLPLKIVAKTKIKIGEYADSTFRESLDGSAGCWKVDDSDGWKPYEQLLPADVDLEQPLTIEFQIIDGDSLALKDLVNPRLVIITGI